MLLTSFKTILSITVISSFGKRTGFKKQEILEERFAFGEISSDIYHKFKQKVVQEIEEIETSLEAKNVSFTNLEMAIDKLLKTAENLCKIWDTADYQQKLNLQNTLFPDGMAYNNKKREFRTQNINNMFGLTLSKSNQLTANKKRINDADFSFILLSRGERIRTSALAPPRRAL